MPIAAVPGYLLKQDLSQSSPGMRFGMYLRIWGVNNRTGERLWTTSDINYRVAGRDQQERMYEDDNKGSALRQATSLTEADKRVMGELNQRQSALALVVSAECVLTLHGKAIAPFTTGLGNEHPLENGFAFLNPYGLPYLPGSGIKGVLRQAARDLASGEWGKTHGWNDTAVEVLFGKEGKDGENEHQRGALGFWDVIPRVEDNRLMVEIMTPHQAHYYQKSPHAGSTHPHDSGQPKPISFLTVPPGSGFTFHVTCDLARLRLFASDLAGDERWKTLLRAAFEHAFTWCGFGAKTTVGYGAMAQDPEAEVRAEKARAEREAALALQREEDERQARREAELAALDPMEREIEEFLDHRPDKNQPEISAVIGAVKQGKWQGEDKVAVAGWLKARMQAAKGQWKETSQAKRPDKDKEHQNTLLVQRWLEGQ